MPENTRPLDDAFPATIYMGEIAVDSSDGLTKREFFAALALAGLLASSNDDLEPIARSAVRAADSLIEALNAQ